MSYRVIIWIIWLILLACVIYFACWSLFALATSIFDDITGTDEGWKLYWDTWKKE